MKNIAEYQNPKMSLVAVPTPCQNPLSGKKEAIVLGMNMIDCAKMIGITPAALTRSGRYCVVPPNTFRPTTRLAYWTGIRRVPCVTRTTNIVTRKRAAISIRKMKRLAPWSISL